jgi:pimeloyl-ACP methyl ester carboxylesterase
MVPVVVSTLRETIPFLPHVKSGTYDPSVGTFVLVGGSSYQCTDFDTFEVAESNDFYRKFDYEVEFPHINFQARLSRQSATFSFDRPTDLLNHNLYAGGTHGRVYVASWRDLTVERYARFMRSLFEHHELKPPYIFVACSEGGYDVLCFARHFARLVKKIYFIDTPIVGRYWERFETFRGNRQWYKDLEARKLSWEPTRAMDVSEEMLERIDVYNFEVKTVSVINQFTIDDFPQKTPMAFLWSPYFDSPTAVSREKVSILKELSAALKRRYAGAMCLFVDAPHQVERVLPLSLAAFITSTSRSAARFTHASTLGLPRASIGPARAKGADRNSCAVL